MNSKQIFGKKFSFQMIFFETKERLILLLIFWVNIDAKNLNESRFLRKPGSSGSYLLKICERMVGQNLNLEIDQSNFCFFGCSNSEKPCEWPWSKENYGIFLFVSHQKQIENLAFLVWSKFEHRDQIFILINTFCLFFQLLLLWTWSKLSLSHLFASDWEQIGRIQQSWKVYKTWLWIRNYWKFEFDWWAFQFIFTFYKF